MNNDTGLSKLIVGAIVGAVTVEYLREKKPEVLDDIKEHTKGLVSAFKPVYKDMEKTLNDVTDSISKIDKESSTRKSKKKNQKRGGD